jgi:hypothetical protein
MVGFQPLTMWAGKSGRALENPIGKEGGRFFCRQGSEKGDDILAYKRRDEDERTNEKKRDHVHGDCFYLGPSVFSCSG